MSRARVIFDSAGEVVEYELGPGRARDAGLWKAFLLSPRLEVAEALLRGESVPVDALDAEWLARLGGQP